MDILAVDVMTPEIVLALDVEDRACAVGDNGGEGGVLSNPYCAAGVQM